MPRLGDKNIESHSEKVKMSFSVLFITSGEGD